MSRLPLARIAALCAAAALSASLPVLAQTAKPAGSDLDAFMARVLERRDENWRRSHDYVLDEEERVTVVGPAGIRLFGQQRTFTWYIRDGYFVRSPLESNGVSLSDDDRRAYEEKWLAREQRRDKQEQDEAAKPPAEAPDAAPPSVDPGEVASLVRQGGEPRFISEAYFLKFKFEPGNYYLAGRETFDGREVLRIEYYPQRLFAEGDEVTVSAGGDVPDDRVKRGAQAERKPPAREKSRRQPGAEHEVDEQDMLRRMNKVALVTLWVDPAEHQIVKFTFNNVGLGFLPGQWLVRVGDTSATMVMGRVFDGAWLPREISMHVDLTLASGTFDAQFNRQFSNYRRAETSAKIRSYRPMER